MDNVIVWAGWIAGAAIGLYLLLQFWITGKALGASGSYGAACGLFSRRTFFRTGPFEDRWSWRLFFMIGLPLGGALGVLTSPGAEWVPGFSMGALYDSVLPEAIWAKALVVTAGGGAIGYGARMADGCQSGHAIAGMSMLNPPSLLAAIGFFAGGTVMVQLLFRLLGA